MFQRLTLTNWQCYPKATIDFSPGLTVLVGASNSGKSAIVRALRRVIRDEGPTAVRYGETETTLQLVCSGGTVARHLKVRRSKDKKPQMVENTYRANDQEFKAVGDTIPAEVLAVHGLAAGVLSDYDLDLHFGNQHDSIFLLKATASIRSKVLAKLSGVELLDRCVQIENGYIRAAKDARGTATQRLEERQGALQQFEQLPSWQKLLAQAEALELSMAEQQAKIQRTQQRLATFEQVRQQRRGARAKLEGYRQGDIDGMSAHLSRIRAGAEKLQLVLDAGVRRARVEEQYRASGVLLATAVKEYLALKATIKVCPTCGQTLAEDAHLLEV
jgi:exonuclease SbcC